MIGLFAVVLRRLLARQIVAWPPRRAIGIEGSSCRSGKPTERSTVGFAHHEKSVAILVVVGEAHPASVRLSAREASPRRVVSSMPTVSANERGETHDGKGNRNLLWANMVAFSHSPTTGPV